MGLLLALYIKFLRHNSSASHSIRSANKISSTNFVGMLGRSIPQLAISQNALAFWRARWGERETNMISFNITQNFLAPKDIYTSITTDTP
jgi:hypothetical protein